MSATITTPAPAPHTHVEDLVAIVTGVAMVSVGVALVAGAGLLTGGITGLAFVLHYATGIGFGKLFFVLNLPFYWLALRKLGLGFTLKTFAGVALLAVLTEVQPLLMQIGSIQPLYAALVGGLCMGCSLGGIGILALYLQGRFGWRAGAVQMVADFCIVLAALATVEPMRVLWSVIGAVVLNQVLAINHRPGRYMAA